MKIPRTLMIHTCDHDIYTLVYKLQHPNVRYSYITNLSDFNGDVSELISTPLAWALQAKYKDEILVCNFLNKPDMFHKFLYFKLTIKYLFIKRVYF